MAMLTHLSFPICLWLTPIGAQRSRSNWASLQSCSANTFIISLIFCFFFFFHYSTCSCGLPIKFFFSETWESVLSFSPLFALPFTITMGPFQTIIFKGHLFHSMCSWAWQWVNDTRASHIQTASHQLYDHKQLLSQRKRIQQAPSKKPTPKKLVKMLKYISQLHKILLYCLASFQTWHGLFCLWTQVEQKATECNLCQELDYRRTTNSN